MSHSNDVLAFLLFLAYAAAVWACYELMYSKPQCSNLCNVCRRPTAEELDAAFDNYTRLLEQQGASSDDKACFVDAVDGMLGSIRKG